MQTQSAHSRFKQICPSDGTLNSAPCQGHQLPWHPKDHFSGFRTSVGFNEGRQVNVKAGHISIVDAAVKLLKYY